MSSFLCEARKQQSHHTVGFFISIAYSTSIFFPQKQLFVPVTDMKSEEK